MGCYNKHKLHKNDKKRQKTIDLFYKISYNVAEPAQKNTEEVISKVKLKE